MLEDISELKVNQALLEQRLEQSDKVIAKLTETLSSLDAKVTKGFYIGVGIVLMASGTLTDVAKSLIKFIGG